MIDLPGTVVKTGILMLFMLSFGILYSKNYAYSEIKIGETFTIKELGSVYLPKSYSTEKKYPLLVALHPFGSTSSQFIKSFIDEAEKREMIVIAGQASGIYWDGNRKSPDPKHVKALISEIKKNFSVDSKKVLLFGFSSGGSFTHQIVATNRDKNGEKFVTAYCSVSGGAGYTFETKFIKRDRMPDNLKIPAFFIWGKLEEPQPAKDVYDFLVKKGWDVTLKVHDGGHYIPARGISDVLDWFQQKCGVNA
jgi:phospholipase/carboxylesterase